jgi:membrane-associated phospholipid phosphatase
METYIQMFSAENLQPIPGILLWGIEVIKVIQKLKSPALTAVLSLITELGTDKFYIPAVMFIFWWIDEKKGFRLGLLILLSGWINEFLKDIFKQPRPYNFDPSLGLAYEPTYGAPSGHAQNALCFWVPIAAWLAGGKPGRKRILVWAAAVSFILLIGFTRLYLGVHFPTDLFAGWILGALILLLMYFLSPLFVKHLAAQTRTQNILSAIAALVMISLYPGDRSLPAIFLGFCLGYNIMKKNFPFCAQSEIKENKLLLMFLRCLAGFAGLAIVYVVPRLLLPGDGSLFRYIPLWSQASPFYELGRFIRYCLVGLWASAGAPMIFQRMGLSFAAKNENSAPVNKPKDDET